MYTDEQIGTLEITGDPARFVATEKVPISGLTMDFEPVQDLHGYDYPWPAGGGKNLLDPSLLKDQVAWNNFSLNLKANTKYTMSTNLPSAKTSELACYFIRDGLSPGSGTLVDASNPVSITAPESGEVKIQQRRITGSDSFQNYNWQVEESETATSYAPYENICPITGRDSVNVYVSPTPEIGDGTEIYDIDFDQTVYGGTLTINEDGSGTINSTMASVDLGTLTWAYREANAVFFADVSGRKPQDTAAMSNLICSSYKTIIVHGLSSQIDDMSVCGRASSSYILIADSRFTDANAFTSEVTGQTLVYELAEPVTIELTPEEITTLIGMNYVWTSDNNLITLTFPYRKEIQPMQLNYDHCWTYPKAVIDKLIKRIEDLEDAVETLEAAKSGVTKAATTENEITEPVEETVTETKKGGK